MPYWALQENFKATAGLKRWFAWRTKEPAFLDAFCLCGLLSLRGLVGLRCSATQSLPSSHTTRKICRTPPSLWCWAQLFLLEQLVFGYAWVLLRVLEMCSSNFPIGSGVEPFLLCHLLRAKKRCARCVQYYLSHGSKSKKDQTSAKSSKSAPPLPPRPVKKQPAQAADGSIGNDGAQRAAPAKPASAALRVPRLQKFEEKSDDDQDVESPSVMDSPTQESNTLLGVDTSHSFAIATPLSAHSPHPSLSIGAATLPARLSTHLRVQSTPSGRGVTPPPRPPRPSPEDVARHTDSQADSTSSAVKTPEVEAKTSKDVEETPEQAAVREAKRTKVVHELFETERYGETLGSPLASADACNHAQCNAGPTQRI